MDAGTRRLKTPDMTSSLTHYAVKAAALSVSEIHFNSRYSSDLTLRNQPITVAIALQRLPAGTNREGGGAGVRPDGRLRTKSHE
jgi:hypothetical protein